MACTFTVARSAETFPPTAVTATTSKRGSNSARVRASASSIPGSQSMMTLRGMIRPCGGESLGIYRRNDSKTVENGSQGGEYNRAWQLVCRLWAIDYQ